MSVTDTEKIDLLSFDNSGECVLTITDHLEWHDDEHLLLLQAKLNAYLAYIESGKLEESYPDAANRRKRIVVVALHEPDARGIEFFSKASAIIEDAGYSLHWTQFEEDE